jgi:hypothetical protein
MTIFYIMLIAGVIGFLIGQKKRYGLQGFIAGALLGFIGWIWIATLKPRWRCPECGGAVEKGFNRCKNCGADIKPQNSDQKASAARIEGQAIPPAPVKKKPVAGYVLLVLVAIIVASYYVQKGSIPLSKIGITNSSSQAVTMDKYLQIRDGMSYQEAIGIIGKTGEESSRNKIDGVPGVMETVVTVMYQWTNKDGTGMNAIFQNNKLVQKAQFGLR